MKFLGIDGKYYVINFEKNSREVENPSALHLTARKIIEKCFPYCTVYEEITLSGCTINKSALVADFFLPQLPMIIEVHGQQHYQFVKHFHKTEAQYNESLQRDKIKKEWCELNNITYVELPYNEIQKWKKIINDKLN